MSKKSKFFRGSFHDYKKYEQARSDTERYKSKTSMESYLRRNGLNLSLLCLLGLVPNFTHHPAHSKIIKSKMLQMIEPSKEEIEEVARWIELNHWDEVVPILSFSKGLTIHQLACAILKLEKHCLDKKAVSGFTFSLLVAVLLRNLRAGLEEQSIPKKVEDNIDAMSQIVWSLNR